MSTTPKYYPPVSDLVDASALPGDLQGVEDFLQDGIDLLLGKLYYKDLVVEVLNAGDTKYYSLTLLSKSLRLPLIGEMNLVFFRGDDTLLSEFPIIFEWSWPLFKYIPEFEIQGFSYAPEAFLDILIELSEIRSREEFFDQIVQVFLDDGNNAYLEFFDNISSYIPLVYDNGETAVTPEIQNIIDKLAIIKNELEVQLTSTNLFTLRHLYENYQSNTVLNPAVESINQSLTILENDHDIQVAIYRDVLINLFLGFSDLDEKFNRLLRLFRNWIEDIDVEDIKRFLIPQFSFELSSINMALEFPRNWLQPVYTGVEPVTGLNINDPLPDSYQSALEFNVGKLLFSTQYGFKFENQSSFTFKRSMIGKTGLLVEFINLKVDMSKNNNIPEAIADNRSEGFMGVYAEKAAITLPSKWFNSVDNTTLQIAGYNMLVGTGGISGRIAIETVNGTPSTEDDYLDVKIGNWVLGFNRFDLTFRQNSIIESNIRGNLKIPKLKDNAGHDAEILISGHLQEDGDFHLTASEPQGIPATLFDFVTINFLSLELGREDNSFFIGTSCEIWFENAIMKKLLDDQKIVIPKLRIYENGRMEIVGGTSFIPTNISLDLGPVEVAVTGIHFGSHQQEHNGVMRKYNYWGFDGAISLDPLGIDARGEGVKYYYTVDNDEHGGSGDNFLHIQTIEVNLIIPGSASPDTALAIINGMLSIPEPGESAEYVGDVSLKIPKITTVAGGVAMQLQPRHPAFLLDAHVDLPAPIPLGPVAIYGFRGLMGFRYVAEKEAVGLVSGEDTWYDYYTYPPRGLHVSKLSGPEKTASYSPALALGAGAVLGTSFDSGTAISARVMMLLSLPSVFAVDGRASVLSQRLGLDDSGEPPFFAFMIIGDNSLEMGFGADFKLPQNNGWILDLYAEVQAAFFFNNPSAWYINFGTREKPITATVLSLFRMQNYLMISGRGIEAGARADFNLEKRFGPAKVHIRAYLELGGFVSFERPQIGGYLTAGGMIDIDIWIVRITIELNATFSVEAPKPFLIFAEFGIRVCIKIIFAKVCKGFTIRIKWEKSSEVNTTSIPPLPHQTADNQVNRTNELVKAIHMLTNESFDINYLGSSLPSNDNSITAIIPLDTYIDIKTVKGLIPTAVSGSGKLGGHTGGADGYTDLIPPQRVVRGGREIRQVKHKYSVEAIEIKVWVPDEAHENGGTWESYHPFQALVDSETNPSINLNHLRVGYWQRSGKQYDTIRLLANNAFSYTEAGEPGWFKPEEYGITASELFCRSEDRASQCSNVLNKVVGRLYYPPTQYIGHYINGAYYTLEGEFFVDVTLNDDGSQNITENQEYFRVSDENNSFNFPKSIEFNNGSSLVIILPEPSVEVKLKLNTYADGLTIIYYKSDGIENYNTVYSQIHQEYKTSSQVQTELTYENQTSFISKIVIKPDGLNQQEQEAPCQRDEKLCDLSNTLLKDLQICIESKQQEQTKEGQSKESSKEGQSNKDWSCFENFISAIETFDRDNPNYNLASILGQYLQNLSNYLMREDAIIEGAYELSYTIILEIRKLGDCDCQEQIPEPIDKFTTLLQEVCWMSVEDWEYNSTIPSQNAIQEDYANMVEAIQNSIKPIWRPNASYYVHFSLKDEVDNGTNVGTYDYYYGFKTAGPIGHYHKHPNVSYLPEGAKPEQYTLTSLRKYIDYKRSYPNADGNLLQTKPLFYGNEQAKIQLYFTQPFVQHMLGNWPEYQGLPSIIGEMQIAIKDPVTDVLIPYPLPVTEDDGTIPGTTQTWEDDNDPRIPLNIQMINNFINWINENNNAISCVFNPGDAIKPGSKFQSITLTNLKAQKLYTAIIYNTLHTGEAKSEEVHRFVFQTSRYESFKVQVESYKLKDVDEADNVIDEREAIFEIPLNLSEADINTAYNIITGNPDIASDNLETKYYHPFDRIVEGVLGFKPIDVAQSTEFNILKTSTGEVIGILIRNPEPFNIPKIPVEEIADTIKVMLDTNTVDSDYVTLHSKDYSQVLIMYNNNSKKIVADALNFRFQYKTWDGSAYIVDESSSLEHSVFVENIQIN